MSNRPVHEIRLGHVKAVIWANNSGTEGRIRHAVSIQPVYRDGDTWATSDSFGRDDLPLLSKVADLAHTWIFIETQNGLGRSEDDDRNKPISQEKTGNRAGSRR